MMPRAVLVTEIMWASAELVVIEPSSSSPSQYSLVGFAVAVVAAAVDSLPAFGRIDLLSAEVAAQSAQVVTARTYCLQKAWTARTRTSQWWLGVPLCYPILASVERYLQRWNENAMAVFASITVKADPMIPTSKCTISWQSCLGLSVVFGRLVADRS